jgi:magnesium transporter
MVVNDLRELIATSSYKQVKTTVNQTTASQVVEVLRDLTPKQQVVTFRLLDKDRALEVFEMLEPAEQRRLVEAMEDPEVLQLLEQLDPDDRVRLFDELPAKVTKRLLAGLSAEARKSVNLLLGYPADSVGRVMSPRYQAIRLDITAGAALAAVRASNLRADELSNIFVIDEGRFYQGYVALADLVKASDQTPVRALLRGNDVFVRAKEKRLAGSYLLKEHDLSAVAVLDGEGRMVGALTFDDAIDILDEDASETMYKKAGVADIARSKDEIWSKRLTQGPIGYPIRLRITFLLVTLAGGLAVGGVIDAFEGTLEAILAAAIFIPVVMDMGGNVGTQSTTIFARGIARGHISMARFWPHARREVTIGAIMGVILGTIGGLAAYFWQGLPNGVPQLGLAVGISLATVITLATFLGYLLPYVLIRMGFDHAPGADPFITTIKDFVGLALYFYLITLLIGVGSEESTLGLLQLLPWG